MSKVLIGVALAGALMAGGEEQRAERQPAAAKQDDVFPIRLDAFDPETSRTIKPGDLADAKKYYAESVSMQLDLAGGDRPFEDLGALLAYFGYGQLLKAEEVDILPPRELAAKVAGGDVLAARYFSPKTSDVSGLSNKLSWRKVVRLKARADSEAEKAGLAAMHFLSVVYVDRATDDPFPPSKSKTLNVQVLLSRKPGWDDDKDPAYWLVFDPAGGKYTLGYSTTTSWDAADPALIAMKGSQQYFVPTACRTCHGGTQRVAVLHSFDTDWFIDKVQPDEDFGTAFRDAKWGPLYDCMTGPNAMPDKDGFDIFRRLNAEILAQNRAVLAFAEKSDPKHQREPTRQVARQTAAAAKWIDLHKLSDRHVPTRDRALRDSPTAPAWDKAEPIDRELLPLLNRYCYRCHTSVRYNAFAKEELVRKRGDGMLVERMIARLTEPDRKRRMPQDRDMEARHNGDWKKLLDLLQKLREKHQPK